MVKIAELLLAPIIRNLRFFGCDLKSWCDPTSVRQWNVGVDLSAFPVMVTAAMNVLHFVLGFGQFLQAQQHGQDQRKRCNAKCFGGQRGDGAHSEGGQ